MVLVKTLWDRKLNKMSQMWERDLLGRRWGRGEKDIREVGARAIRMHYVSIWS